VTYPFKTVGFDKFLLIVPEIERKEVQLGLSVMK